MLDKHKMYYLNKTFLSKSFNFFGIFGQSEKIRMIEQEYTKKYIRNEVSVLLSNINKYSFEEDSSEFHSIPRTFFIFWWQVDNVPELVKNNIRLLKKHSNAQIVVITQRNVQKYVKNIPVKILEMVMSKEISLAYFSDILRTLLLFERGGVWIDATVMTLKNVDDCIFLNNVFTPINLDQSDRFIPKGRWNGNCLGSRQKNGAMKFVNEALVHFALYYKNIPDYFTIDYLLDIAYTFNIGNFKDDLLRLGNNNVAYNDLAEKLNLKYSEKNFTKILSRTTFFKTSWREEYRSFTDSGELTYMGKIRLKENLQ